MSLARAPPPGQGGPWSREAGPQAPIRIRGPLEASGPGQWPAQPASAHGRTPRAHPTGPSSPISGALVPSLGPLFFFPAEPGPSFKCPSFHGEATMFSRALFPLGLCYGYCQGPVSCLSPPAPPSALVTGAHRAGIPAPFPGQPHVLLVPWVPGHLTSRPAPAHGLWPLRQPLSFPKRGEDRCVSPPRPVSSGVADLTPALLSGVEMGGEAPVPGDCYCHLGLQPRDLELSCSSLGW